MVLSRETSRHDMSDFTGNAVSAGRLHFEPKTTDTSEIQLTDHNRTRLDNNFWPSSATSIVQDYARLLDFDSLTRVAIAEIWPYSGS
jgi:hypothetical protein